jgi:hypothetical protein
LMLVPHRHTYIRKECHIFKAKSKVVFRA